MHNLNFEMMITHRNNSGTLIILVVLLLLFSVLVMIYILEYWHIYYMVVF